MSRINRPRVAEGATISGSDLDARFTDYSQAGALDKANHRDGSIDLPQVRGEGLITLNSAQGVLGSGVWDHSSVQSIASSGSSPPTLVEVGAGATRLALGGLAGWTLNDGEVLRIYWDIGAQCLVSGRPYASGTGAAGILGIDDGAGGFFDITDCAHCWVMHLQWDVTSAALTHWLAVPGQGDYQSGTPAAENNANQAGQSVISAWLEYSLPGNASNGAVGDRTSKPQVWNGVRGSYFNALDTGDGPVTVYGLRMVVSGIYHPDFSTSFNQLKLDHVVAGAGQTLELSQGQIMALHQRMR